MEESLGAEDINERKSHNSRYKWRNVLEYCYLIIVLHNNICDMITTVILFI